MKKSFLHKSIFHILLFIILIVIAYSNTFHVPFQFDDKPAIVENPVIKDLSFFADPSRSDTLKGHYENITFKMRYISFLTFALNYRLHGLDVTGYHIVNLLIHIINALLVYVLVLLSFKTPFLDKSSIKDYAVHIAVFSALLFACHPVQTQAVTYIWQRVTSLATMFYVLSLVSYARWRLLMPEAGPDIKSFLNDRALFYYLATITSAVLAMESKETAFTLPVIIVLYEIIFFKCRFKRVVAYLVPILLTMSVIPLNLMGQKKSAGDLIGFISESTMIETTMNRFEYLFTQFRVIITYIRLIFLPVNQNLDYDYPVFHSLFDSEVFLSFLFILAILSIGVFLFKRFRHSSAYTRLISFGIFWFFIALSVESSLISLRDVIYEHRVYLPSIGLFIMISTLVFAVAVKLKVKWKNVDRSLVAVLSVIVILLTGTTYMRNLVWKDSITLWEDVVSKSPQKERGHNNLGFAYHLKGSHYKAVKHLKTAVKLAPDYTLAHVNLGTSYYSQGLFDNAIEHYQAAVKLKPDWAKAYSNLGAAYFAKGMTDEAIKYLETAIKLEPEAMAHNNLGTAYYSRGLTDKALEQFRIAVRLNPDRADAHFRLGSVYFKKGELRKAREAFEKGLNINPIDTEARRFLYLINKREMQD